MTYKHLTGAYLWKALLENISNFNKRNGWNEGVVGGFFPQTNKRSSPVYSGLDSLFFSLND